MYSQYDCIVVGAGPAGGTTAALVAQAGYSTLLVEREALPRFHVGESLMPETYWTLRRLGVIDQMKSRGFVKKHSVQFVTNKGKESAPFYFEMHDPRECAQTWQVERAEFDKMLFDNAAEKGAHCYDRTRLMDVKFADGRAQGVVLKSEATGETTEVGCQVLVDATGQSAVIANKLGARDDDPKLRKAAIWAYYKNAMRGEDIDQGATIILHTQSKKCWFWFIPLKDQVTSIGLVGDHAELLKSGLTPEEMFEDQLVNCPSLAKRLVNAEMVDKFRVAKEFSYSTKQRSGDGWVLVGDAYGFIDPVYSSGVYFALKTGEMAADAIAEGLSKGDTSAAQLGKWVPEFDEGAKWIRKLVSAFYANEFSFGEFMRMYPHHKNNLTDILIGRVYYDGAGKIFEDMEPAMEAAREKAKSEMMSEMN